MTTTTSFFKADGFGQIYRHTVSRNIGMTIFLTLIGFILYPLQFLLTSLEAQRNIKEVLLRAANSGVDAGGYPMVMDEYFFGHALIYPAFSIVAFSAFVFIIPFLISGLIYSYMQNKRSSDLYHALPIRRETLLLANFSAGMTILAIPVILSFLCVIPMGLAFFPNEFQVGGLLLDLLLWLLTLLFIFSVCTFAAVNTGSSFDQILFTLGLAGAPILVFFMTEYMISQMFGMVGMLPRVLFFLAPFMPIIRSLTTDAMIPMMGLVSDFLLWLIIAAALVAGSVLLYRRRKSEVSGQPVRFSVVKTILLACGVYVGSILFGIMLETTQNNSNDVIFVVGSVLGAMLSYVIIEAILNRGFKVIRKSLPWIAVSMVVMGAVTFAFKADIFQREMAVPSVDQIASVEMDYDGLYSDISQYNGDWFNVQPSDNVQHTTRVYEFNAIRSGKFQTHDYVRDDGDKAYVYSPTNNYTINYDSDTGKELVVGLHQAIVDYYRQNGEDETWSAETGEEKPTGSINAGITYHLKNGMTLERYYYSAPVEAIRKLAALNFTPEYLEARQPVYHTKAADLEKITLMDRLGINTTELQKDEAFQEELLSALREDLLEQNIDSYFAPKEHILGYIVFEYQELKEPAGTFYDNSYVIVTAEMERTEKLLRENGLLEKMALDPAKITELTVNLNDWNVDAFLGDRTIYAPSPIQLVERYSKAARAEKSDEQITLTDPAQIREVLDAAYNVYYFNSRWQSFGQMTACLPRTDEKELPSMTLYIPQEKAPAFLKQIQMDQGLSPDTTGTSSITGGEYGFVF